MKRLLLLIVLASFSVAATSSWGTVAEKLEKSVVPIAGENDTHCTGFVINTDKKYVLTAAHCFATTLYADNEPAKVVARDPKKDLMVLVVPELDRPALRLAKDNPRVSEQVASYGFGYAFERPMFRLVHVADDETYIPEGGIGGPLIVLDGAFVPGQSGGPVVNAVGDVVAIVQMASDRVGLGRGAEAIKGSMGKYFEKAP